MVEADFKACLPRSAIVLLQVGVRVVRALARTDVYNIHSRAADRKKVDVALPLAHVHAVVHAGIGQGGHGRDGGRQAEGQQNCCQFANISHKCSDPFEI